MEKLIFNSSMPRSGSELLQAILHQNPRIYGSVTSPLLEYQFTARNNYELPEVKAQDPVIMQKAFLAMNKSMAEGYYSEITDRPIVIDKNRGWSHYYEWVEQWNPNPKMICMVRDLRSIIASLEKIYRANRHTPAGPDIPTQLINMSVEQRAEYWLKTQPVGLALQRTLDVFQKGLAGKIHFVRYEDLCNTPEQILNGIYEYLEEEPFQHDFNNIVKEVYENDSYYGVYGNHTVKNKLQPSLVGEWGKMINKPISKKIEQFVPWYFEQFNY